MCSLQITLLATYDMRTQTCDNLAFEAHFPFSALYKKATCTARCMSKDIELGTVITRGSEALHRASNAPSLRNTRHHALKCSVMSPLPPLWSPSQVVPAPLAISLPHSGCYLPVIFTKPSTPSVGGHLHVARADSGRLRHPDILV